MLKRKSNLNAFLNYIPAVVYMAFIFYLSSIPLRFPEVIDIIDPTKFFLHIAEYSLLGFLLSCANSSKMLSIFIGSAYGLSDELHQSFVPFRKFSIFDLLADVIGVCVGIALFMYFISKKKT